MGSVAGQFHPVGRAVCVEPCSTCRTAAHCFWDALGRAGGDADMWQTDLASQILWLKLLYGTGSHSHCCSIWIVTAEREELAGPTDTGQGLHSCIPSGRLWQISVLQCFSFQRKLLGKGYGTATQFPLDRKQQFSPTNCRFFLENSPRNESVKGTAQNRLLFQLATAECTCVGLFLSPSHKNNFHHFKSFFQVAQAGFISQHSSRRNLYLNLVNGRGWVDEPVTELNKYSRYPNEFVIYSKVLKKNAKTILIRSLSGKLPVPAVKPGPMYSGADIFLQHRTKWTLQQCWL